MDKFLNELLNEARQYAPYFALSKDKQQNELEVVHLFNQELKNRGASYFDSIFSREPGQDPPDCEAIGNGGERIGIEVTELVDGDAITSAKKREMLDQDLPIPSQQVINEVSAIIRRKDNAIVKGEPYDLYILIIYCDDPKFLDFEIISELRNKRFRPTNLIDHAYFLESYNP